MSQGPDPFQPNGLVGTMHDPDQVARPEDDARALLDLHDSNFVDHIPGGGDCRAGFLNWTDAGEPDEAGGQASERKAPAQQHLSVNLRLGDRTLQIFRPDQQFLAGMN